MRAAGRAEGQRRLERSGTAIAVAGNGRVSVNGYFGALATEKTHFPHLVGIVFESETITVVELLEGGR